MTQNESFFLYCIVLLFGVCVHASGGMGLGRGGGEGACLLLPKICRFIKRQELLNMFLYLLIFIHFKLYFFLCLQWRRLIF